MGFVSKEQIATARCTDLFGFLNLRHPTEFVKEGQSLRMKRNHSISIATDYSGYRDFATSEKGNSIDFLVRHLNYGFVDAVQALNAYAGHDALSSVTVAGAGKWEPTNKRKCSTKNTKTKDKLPLRNDIDSSRVLSYLASRGIPEWMSQRLMQSGLLYQEAKTNNIVFVSEEHDFCELRGTVPNNPFHQCRKADADRYWSFCPMLAPPLLAFICESSIDALSLYLLRGYYGQEPDAFPAVYCSIGGVCNNNAIDRICAQYVSILAVDNDQAGEKCRERYPNLGHFIPQKKDWNEDLLDLIAKQNTRNTQNSVTQNESKNQPKMKNAL